jgi:hypothetical protein
MMVAWNKVDIEILIHAPPSQSGSLIRLLKSLERADYMSFRVPRLTIELPPEIDGPTLQYLQNFNWPPGQAGGHSNGMLTIRHHLFRDTSKEESSTRFLESFYPVRPSDSHVLVLSPNTEVSPVFYHYLKYALLEYKYSVFGVGSANSLYGISLQLPTVHLDGVTELKAPKATIANDRTGQSETVNAPFLWQSPNSNAALYYGDKWSEFHSFLVKRLSPEFKKPQMMQMASTQPVWLDYLAEFARAKGYVMVYPNWDNGEALATVHNELNPYPGDATSHKTSEEPKDEVPDTDGDGNIITELPPLTSKSGKEAAMINHKSLVSQLPNQGDLPEINNMPVLTYDGSLSTLLKLPADSREFIDIFRQTIGGCTGGKTSKGPFGELFCAHADPEKDDTPPTPKKEDHTEEPKAPARKPPVRADQKGPETPPVRTNQRVAKPGGSVPDQAVEDVKVAKAAAEKDLKDSPPSKAEDDNPFHPAHTPPVPKRAKPLSDEEEESTRADKEPQKKVHARDFSPLRMAKTPVGRFQYGDSQREQAHESEAARVLSGLEGTPYKPNPAVGTDLASSGFYKEPEPIRRWKVEGQGRRVDLNAAL